MGILRALFAVSVVVEHSYHGAATLLIGGKIAVQLFYIISGFLISYVLVERKAYPKKIDFYINRYLRLYPIYFTVAILTLFSHCFRGSEFLDIYKNTPLSANILLIFSNMFLFCQDWVMFFGIAQEKLIVMLDFRKSPILLYQGLLVPQAWTLGVELSFYVIAPFILHNRQLLFVLLALSIALRIYLLSIGIGMHDPWTYRFFPSELALFLLGALAQQILLPWYKKLFSKHLLFLSRAATFFLIALTLVYGLVPVTEWLKSAFLFTAFLLLIPFTFIFQNTYKLDKGIGDLSYPIYIGHMMVIPTTTYFMATIGYPANDFLPLSCAITAVMFAFLLNRYVGTPLEKIRGRFRSTPVKAF